jgi:hypothetical protein
VLRRVDGDCRRRAQCLAKPADVSPRDLPEPSDAAALGQRGAVDALGADVDPDVQSGVRQTP